MTFSVITLGCKVNQCESESIAREMVSKGFVKPEKRRGPAEQKPAICIINTCTVTRKAAMQSRQAIRQAIRCNPEALIVVTGCLAQTAPEEIKKIDGVQYIVGHADKPRIADLASAMKPDRVSQPEIIHRGIRDIRTYQDMRLPALGSRTRPFLKIQDGCDAFCTYCIVPFARGPSRSMPMERVTRHIRHIREAGYHEIVLTGIHLGRYGIDLSPEIDLSFLLKHLCGGESIDRIRLSSMEPLELTPKLIELAARADRRPGQICPHFHIPLQSGDDEILKRMHRPYRRDDFRKRVLHILEMLPHAAVGADVLIGFPGETDPAFENTFRLLEELPLAYLHVFPFSARKGTPAAEYPNHVPQQIIKERCRRTRAMGVQKRKAFIQHWLDQDLEVLVEDSRDAHSGMLTGVTSNYIKVLLNGEDRLQNTFQKVHIEALADERTLSGRLQSSCHLSE
ncbi:tRNA (N(6)-L-threonylcarbamoyladenosine(37)-C(2))-methylthiotransferase MtaB [Desulfosarcina sp.]|uniref:tRNA (N(6)-L-threonylcarbamoyladenosine(37)-C(2))- methylthiotransferase MtaB n=1 Tax=Desulfosarcina sp. TaxID=2027861 RepID=UPI0039705B8B